MGTSHSQCRTGLSAAFGPPTINYGTPDPEIPLDVVANQKRDHPANIVLSSSFGFGRQNVALVIGGEPPA